MTYCVGVCLSEGIVMMSDTRTNAGVDAIATFNKMHVWESPGERVLVILTSGNLAVSQAVINTLDEGLELEGTDGPMTLKNVGSMFQAAKLVGRAVRAVYQEYGETMKAQDTGFNISMLLAGQLADRSLRLFQIYAAGNFIEATRETPYLQIGEHKYGKPILDRTLSWDSPLDDAIKACLVSMDSTLKSNLSVGLPIDVAVIKRDACRLSVRKRINDDDPYFRGLRDRWSNALRAAFVDIDAPQWVDEID